MHYQKDVETIIKALKIIEKENFIFFVVGDGPDRDKLEQLVNSLNLQNKIIFLGYRTDIEKILASADLFILSSRWEGLPLVILEAFACKIPVIASKVHGITSVVKDGENGLLFEFKNEKDLAEKILLILKNEDLKKKIIENAYLTVKEKFNLEKMIKAYENLYHTL